MSQDHFDPALEKLIETTTRQIIESFQPGAASDPFMALRQLLLHFLQASRELEHNNAVRRQWDEERAQQN